MPVILFLLLMKLLPNEVTTEVIFLKGKEHIFFQCLNSAWTVPGTWKVFSK